MHLKSRDHSSHEWACHEFENANLGDERLKTRLIKLSARLSESPESPINQACEDWAEAKAAYRFFKNDKVSTQEILASHIHKTANRAKGNSVILAIQDTSYLLYTKHWKTTGLGIVAGREARPEKHLYEHGLVMHSTFAVTTDGLPLGILNQKIFSRRRKPRALSGRGRRESHMKLPVEKKESFRWIESLNKSTQSLTDSDCHVVTVGDREADIFELFIAAFETRSSLLIRAKVDRCINEPYRRHEQREKLWHLIQNKRCAGKIKVEIPSRNGRSGRTALLELRYGSFELYPSVENVKYTKLPSVSLHAVYVVEKNPPQGEEALEWMLLTDLPVTTLEQAVEKVKWYSLRWRIEIFHKILKSGLHVEECRLESADRLARYLSVMSIIAWRIYWIDLIGRTHPKLPCTEVLVDAEWKVLYLKTSKIKKLPKNVPTVHQAVHLIAQLGGFLNRKGDGEPGAQSIWRGWKRLSDLTEGWGIATASMNCG